MSTNSFIIDGKTPINGEWVGADSGVTFPVYNPANGEVLGQVPDQREAETNRAIDAAAAAFEEWQWSPVKTRHDILRKWFSLMTEHAEELARLITLENGKPLADARGEQTYSASFIEWFAAEAMRAYGDHIPATIDGVRNVTIKQPIGVVGIITPWNFPSAMITRKVAAALAAGCTCVIKAPSETPFSALALAKLAEEAGVPKGVINVITTGSSSTVGKILATHPIIKKISFTGSTGVGKVLASQCSSTLKKMSLELGGNAPFIVFDDADIDAAVAGAVICKFRSSGQTCVCANRLFVQSKVYDEFAKKLTEAVSKFKVGNGLEQGITHGPLVNAKAAAKVDEHVQDALAKGAKTLIGGKRGEGAFYEPTVLINIADDAVVMKEETFGPLAPIIKFETEEEVIKKANDTEFGLAGYFFSRDIGRVWRMAEALQVGMVGANTGLISQTSCPFGGVKESGWGKEGSKYGLDDYMVLKYVCMGGINSRR
ncbi:succinate-semialdehyde dehydrogenase [Papiliotrema laurentii]|uniref:Succinate-semialdehyde dehydrogenase n=2 Tax=Opisthokonta TaxID=33154 RepID=A0AAD9CZL8_PAPLA|nr:succinate-semialdehyde dehydrogenase [Papiliotrema laurentii]